MVGPDKVKDPRSKFTRLLVRRRPYLRGKRPANLVVYGCFFNVEPPLGRMQLNREIVAVAGFAVRAYVDEKNLHRALRSGLRERFDEVHTFAG